jgi:hypothetical protein
MTNLNENSKQMYILDTFPIDQKNLNMHRFIEKGCVGINYAIFFSNTNDSCNLKLKLCCVFKT